jgi:predicted DNA-binding WGR domain protein
VPHGAVLLAYSRLNVLHFRDEMPKRRKLAPARPISIQLPLFAETVSLVRIRPALNEWRYYRMEICPPLAIPSGCAGRNLEPASPDLFGRALLVRHWGRIGTHGHRRLDPHPDSEAAINALAILLRAKRRRGYQDRTG